MSADARKNVGLQPINHRRLTKMRAQAELFGYRMKSHDDAVDLLLQVWDRVVADKDGRGVPRMLHSLVKPPKAR